MSSVLRVSYLIFTLLLIVTTVTIVTTSTWSLLGVCLDSLCVLSTAGQLSYLYSVVNSNHSNHSNYKYMVPTGGLFGLIVCPQYCGSVILSLLCC